jgi:rhamnulokinase
MSQAYAAADLGVEGGRVVVGQLEHGRLSLREVHRFTNRPVRVDDSWRWDIQRLYGEVLAGLSAAGRACPGLASVAVDGWGMDFGLLDTHGKLLGLPYHHGDRRTEGIPARLHTRVSEEDLWAATGVQSRPINTLHQLHAMALRRSSTLSRAARLLLVPDLLTCWLSGVAQAEHTLATTTQCYDLERRAWISPLLQRARIPTHVFPPVVVPATPLGPMLTAPARRAGVSGVQVVAAAGHDVAAALAAIPAEVPSWAYVHAGSWSAVGTVTGRTVKTEAAWRLGFTHEAGVGDAACLQRNMAGLGLLQGCRRAWARATPALEEEALARLALAGRPLRAAIDPDDPSLLGADDLPEAVRACCARAGQEVPDTPADLLRVLLESLAWKYRRTVRELEGLLGRRLEVVHVVGPGARHALLCQLTAEACGRPVLAGPVEAAAVGNLLAQAIAAGACGSWAEARAVVRASLPPTVYEPREAAAWEEAAARLEPGLGATPPA